MIRLTVLILMGGLLAGPASGEDWTQWRGPLGNGHSRDKHLPTQWDTESVLWRTELPGLGQSSPIVLGDRIFLTAAGEGGRKRYVLCLSRESGKVIWNRTAWEGEPEKTHRMNNRASSTCATDGKRVVAFFGKGGIHCYDLEGKKLWSRELGDFGGPWGTGASPIIVDNVVIQNCDADDKAAMLGLDKLTGKTIWSTPRQVIRGWSSPVLVKANGRQEVVINGDKIITSYAPQTGKVLWTCRGSRGRGTPTLAPGKGLLVSVCGRSGEMVAVRPGGSGEVNPVWRVPRKGGRDLPSPIVVGDLIIVFKLRPGLVSCYQLSDGKELWTNRLAGQFSSSPIAANGLVYAVNETGEVFVVRASKKYDLVSRNRIQETKEEVFRATITPSQGRLLIRSDRALYCVGHKRVKTSPQVLPSKRTESPRSE